MPKIVLTIEFFATLILTVAWGIEQSYRHDYHSSNGGWTTYYKYNAKVREKAYKASYVSLGVAIIGVLVWIWI